MALCAIDPQRGHPSQNSRYADTSPFLYYYVDFPHPTSFLIHWRVRPSWFSQPPTPLGAFYSSQFSQQPAKNSWRQSCTSCTSMEEMHRHLACLWDAIFSHKVCQFRYPRLKLYNVGFLYFIFTINEIHNLKKISFLITCTAFTSYCKNSPPFLMVICSYNISPYM